MDILECYLCLAYTSQCVQDTASWSGLASHKVLGVGLFVRRRLFLVHSRQDLEYTAEIIVSTCERRVLVHRNRVDGKFDFGHLKDRMWLMKDL